MVIQHYLNGYSHVYMLPSTASVSGRSLNRTGRSGGSVADALVLFFLHLTDVSIIDNSLSNVSVLDITMVKLVCDKELRVVSLFHRVDDS